jgi:hypothetical protein
MNSIEQFKKIIQDHSVLYLRENYTVDGLFTTYLCEKCYTEITFHSNRPIIFLDAIIYKIYSNYSNDENVYSCKFITDEQTIKNIIE